MNAKQAKASKGHQAFNVPHTPEGIAFLQAARKYAHGVRLHSRGRGKRIHDGRRFYDALPIEKSEWIALYADGAGTRCYDRMATEINRLRNEKDTLKTLLEKAKASPPPLPNHSFHDEFVRKLQADLAAALQANKGLAAHLNDIQNENLDNIQSLAKAKQECIDLKDRITRMLHRPAPASTPVPVAPTQGKQVVIRISVE